MAKPSDSELIDRILNGDESAFAVLVHRYSGKCYGIAVSMLRNDQDARDVVQDTFLNVHRRLDTFRGDASFSSWIGRIATNNALMRLRTRRRKPETSLELPGTDEDGSRRERDVVDWSPLADKVSEDRELGKRIRESVANLPDNYRAVLVLADYREMSMREIADALNLTVPNVKTRLHRARLAIRADLSSYVAGRE